MAIKHHGRPGQHRLTLVEATASSAAIVPGAGRPPPPEDLPEAEAALWSTYVRAMPDGWFAKETQPILRQLCVHAVNAQRLHGEVVRARENGADPNAQTRLLKLLGAETKLVLTLSDKLRLTHKSKWSQPQAAARQAQGSRVRPWEESA